MKKRKNMAQVLIGLLLVAALVLIPMACKAPVAPPEEVVAPPVKIGLASGITGPSAYEGTCIMNGMKLAVKHINEAGGIWGGRLVEPLIGDEGMAEDAAALCKKWILEDKVDAIVGNYWSFTSLASVEVCKKYSVPYVNTSSGSPEIPETMVPGMAHYFPTVSAFYRPLLRYAEAQGCKTFQYIAGDCTSTRETAVVLDDYFATSAMECYPDIFFDYTIPDITLELTKAFAKNADFTLFGLFVSSQVVQAMEQRHVTGYKGFSCGYNDCTLSVHCVAAGEAAEGFYALTRYAYDPTVPSNKAFSDAYLAEFGLMPEAWSESGYSGAMTLMLGLDLAGPDFTMEELADAYSAIDYTTPMGYKAEIRRQDGQMLYSSIFLAEYDPAIGTLVKAIELEGQADDMPLYR